METPKIISFDYDFEHHIVEFALKKETICFSTDELKAMKLEKKINYVNLLLFIAGIGFINNYAVELMHTSTDHYLLILLNYVIFMCYNEFIYSPKYELKITKNGNDKLYRIEDHDVFLEFLHLVEYITRYKYTG